MKLRIQKYFFGKKLYQPFWKWVFDTSLKGMNVGYDCGVTTSGEVVVLKKLRKILNVPDTENLVIFDVGANKGDYSTCVAKVLTPPFTLYSFEPSEIAFNQLKLNLNKVAALNGRLHLFQLGFGSVNQKEFLISSEIGSSRGSLYQRDLLNRQSHKIISEPVSIEKIDDFILKNNINLIHLLKLDVEGHELEALKGASKSITENKIKAIQFEFGGCNVDSRTYFKDFFQLLEPSFKIYRILKDGLESIKEYDEKYEIFHTANYLVLKK